MAGVALLVLRCVVALALIVETRSLSALGWAHVLDALVALVGLFLFLGFLTHIALPCVASWSWLFSWPTACRMDFNSAWLG